VQREEKTGQFSGIPATVWVLGIASLFTDVSSEMIHAVLPVFLVTTLSASVLTVGLIEGLGESVASILKVFSGALSDRFASRKWLVVGGYGLSTLLKPLFALAVNPWWVLAARVGDRVGKGIRVAPRDALVADCTAPEKRGAAYGLRQSLDTIGALLGPLFATALLLACAGNCRPVFWLALIPAVLAVILLACGIKEPEKRSSSNKNPLSFSSLKSLGAPYWKLFAVYLLFNLGNSSDAFILLKARSTGVADQYIPLVLVAMNFSYAASAYPAGKLSDLIGRRRLLAPSFALYALVYAGLAFADNWTSIFLLMIAYGLYLGMSQGVLLALVSDTVPPETRGTAFGFINLSMGIALLPASLAAGILWQTVSPACTFFFGSAFASLALLLFLFTRPPAAKAL
jgi:MFS family permease